MGDLYVNVTFPNNTPLDKIEPDVHVALVIYHVTEVSKQNIRVEEIYRLMRPWSCIFSLSRVKVAVGNLLDKGIIRYELGTSDSGIVDFMIRIRKKHLNGIAMLYGSVEECV